MSWLGGDWYGVLAFFGIPAVIGIGCWVIAHSVMGMGERHAREREARRRLPLPHASRRP